MDNFSAILSGESQAETQELINRANEIINNQNAVNRQNLTTNTTDLFNGISQQESAALNQSNLNSQENVANIPNNGYNNNRGNEYGRTDEFRRIQAESRRKSFESVQKQDTYTKSNEGLRQRLSRVFTEEVERSRSNTGNTQLLHLETDKGTSFDIIENIDAQTFHDIFEVVRKYTKQRTVNW